MTYFIYTIPVKLLMSYFLKYFVIIDVGRLLIILSPECTQPILCWCLIELDADSGIVMIRVL